MSKTISIAQVEEEMILAEPILNKFGQILLGAGIVLTAKHLNFFKLWNIEFITIVSEESENTGTEISIEDEELSKENLHKRLSWIPRNLNEEELIEIGYMAELDKIKKNKKNN